MDSQKIFRQDSGVSESSENWTQVTQDRRNKPYSMYDSRENSMILEMPKMPERRRKTSVYSMYNSDDNSDILEMPAKQTWRRRHKSTYPMNDSGENSIILMPSRKPLREDFDESTENLIKYLEADIFLKARMEKLADADKAKETTTGLGSSRTLFDFQEEAEVLKGNKSAKVEEPHEGQRDGEEYDMEYSILSISSNSSADSSDGEYNEDMTLSEFMQTPPSSVPRDSHDHNQDVASDKASDGEAMIPSAKGVGKGQAKSFPVAHQTISAVSRERRAWVNQFADEMAAGIATEKEAKKPSETSTEEREGVKTSMDAEGSEDENWEKVEVPDKKNSERNGAPRKWWGLWRR